jgi:hypothetical protein
MVDKVGTVARRMKARLVKRIANGTDAMGKVFFNLRLLGSEPPGLRVAVMKIWNALTKENAIMARMGSSTHWNTKSP